VLYVHQPQFDKSRHISQCLELAILLESSAQKPGNVNRTAAFQDTRYAHFLASAVAVASSFERAADLGIAVVEGRIQTSEIGIGKIVRECEKDIDSWQHGGNTLLGSILLLSPLAVAAGMTPNKNGVFAISQLRNNIKPIVESTTSEDAVNVYEAIRTARPGGIGKSSELDVNDPDSIRQIRRKKVSLYKIFKIAEGYDRICSEWVNNYPVTFDFAYPCLMKQLREEELEAAILCTFLKVLAKYPDTLIARKADGRTAAWVSSLAENILESTDHKSYRARTEQLDQELRKSGNLLNPGTTADIISATLALSLLGGYRP
jgi:triphosphoribosyl-dephospho-CoA synthase